MPLPLLYAVVATGGLCMGLAENRRRGRSAALALLALARQPKDYSVGSAAHHGSQHIDRLRLGGIKGEKLRYVGEHRFVSPDLERRAIRKFNQFRGKAAFINCS